MATIRPTTTRATTNKAVTTKAVTTRAETVRATTITARQQALINADKATATGKIAQAKTEEAQRTAPVTGTAAGYDPVTGDWLITTPDGGTIRAQALTDGALVGKRLPLQRFGDSQTSAVNAPPSGSNGGAGGNVISQIEAAQRDVLNVLAIEQIDVAIDEPKNRSYTITQYQAYPCRIEALHQPEVDYTIAIAPAVGEPVEVGGTITLTLSGIPDGEDDPIPPPLSVSIATRRI
jgi:hypothetical protein